MVQHGGTPTVPEQPKKTRSAIPIIVVSQPKVEIPGLEKAIEDPLPFVVPGVWRRDSQLPECPFGILRHEVSPHFE
jgi:hypothetical protein